jgi:hypothetical protein
MWPIIVYLKSDKSIYAHQSMTELRYGREYVKILNESGKTEEIHEKLHYRHLAQLIFKLGTFQIEV